MAIRYIPNIVTPSPSKLTIIAERYTKRSDLPLKNTGVPVVPDCVHVVQLFGGLYLEKCYI